ncbi:MAG: hypothetical protein AAB384_00795 [Patescibacteria group bacterium]
MFLLEDFILTINSIFGQQIHSGWELFLFFYVHGGWIILFMFLFRASLEMFYIYRVGRFMGQKFQWHFIAIDIPKENVQTPVAVENIFSHLAGAHQTRDLKEKYWDGQWQQWYSFEIVSIEGHIQFIIMLEHSMRDVTESAIYAQYPDAEITEIEDYAKDFPNTFPDKEYQLWGTEFELVSSQYFPIKTYSSFEDKMSKDDQFKDPMAAILETFTRIGRDEQAWLQIIVFPIGQSWKEEGFKMAKQMLGKSDPPKRHWWHDVGEFPLYILKLAVYGIVGGEEVPKFDNGEKKKDDAMMFGTWNLTPGEVQTIKEMEEKVSKIGYNVKIRVVYIGKKEVFDKSRIVYGIVGAMKQFTREDSNALKPSYKLTGTSAHYIFTDARKNVRRTKMIRAYKSRSAWSGKLPFVLNVEELATLWHFPIKSVRAPLVQKTTSKRGEAPVGLPMVFERRTPPQPQAPAASVPMVIPDEVAHDVLTTAEIDGVHGQSAKNAKMTDAPDNLPFV